MPEVPQHPIEPLTAGITDAALSGFHALEMVAGALAESVRARPSAQGSRPASTQGRATPRGQAGPVAHRAPDPGALTEELVRVFAELLGRAGEVAQSVAQALTPPPGPRENCEPDTPTVARLVTDARGGDPVSAEFTYWNTGTTALRDVTFNASDLVGHAGRISNEEISFEPPSIATIAPGDGVTVTVKVAGNNSRVAADYHGAVTGDPGAGAVLLTVRSTTRQ
ncbi:hypothetical protein ACTXG6_17010 [Pseudonocardia sp. Cha107L01]|uniref:hypothetical protein n=1 Tax=Pseudonocardia sp. Cha107L01 TaxID=3457576 RepID=UPI00403EF6B3